MLSVRPLLRSERLEIADVVCTHGQGRGPDTELAGGHALVLVRRGCFVRSADGRAATLDPTLAYFISAGEEQRYDHPHDGGDACTSVALAPSLLAELWGGDPCLPAVPLPVPPALDVAHRRLLTAVRADADGGDAGERATELVAAMLEQVDAYRVASGAPRPARLRRALADGARELLAERPGRSLDTLARTLAISPHHLSRVFREVTGETISRHRMRLRTRAALERIADGERDLARVAVDAGFVDQSHLCRVVASETGETPSALRAALAPTGR